MPENIFEYAVANKLRFPYKGSATTEDLWDLNVNELDTIYRTLNREVKKADEESLLSTKTKEDIVLSVKIKIVKHIVEVKLAQDAAAKVAAQNKAQAKRIREIIAQKKDNNLQDKSIEELEAMLEDLP